MKELVRSLEPLKSPSRHELTKHVYHHTLYSEHPTEHQQMEWGYLRKPLTPIFVNKGVLSHSKRICLNDFPSFESSAELIVHSINQLKTCSIIYINRNAWLQCYVETIIIMSRTFHRTCCVFHIISPTVKQLQTSGKKQWNAWGFVQFRCSFEAFH